jgi:hypothetical protein
VEQVSTLVTQKLETMIEAANPYQILSKRKATSILLPYAIRLEQNGQQGMVDTILRTARASNSSRFTWRRIDLYMTTLFDKASPLSFNLFITLVNLHAPWGGMCHKNAVARWAATALKVLYTEQLGQCTADALLRIAFIHPTHIPADIWEWLKSQLSLPPVHPERPHGPWRSVVRSVRGFGEIKILKSYFLLIWSEWDYIHSDSLDEMQVSIREDFGGIEMGHHREDLVKRLDDILEQLEQGLGYPMPHNPALAEFSFRVAKERYGKLKEVLLEVDIGAMDIFTRAYPRLLVFNKCTDSRGCAESHSTFTCALPLPCL